MKTDIYNPDQFESDFKKLLENYCTKIVPFTRTLDDKNIDLEHLFIPPFLFLHDSCSYEARTELCQYDTHVVSRHHQSEIVLVINGGLQPIQQHLT